MPERCKVTVLVVLLALAIAGCGSGDEKPKASIPAADVAKLNERLDRLQKQLDVGGGACADITNETRPVIESDLQALPESVDADTRKALNESFERLFQLVDEQCDTSTKPPPTQTQETQTQETQTQETQTQETQTQETQTQEPEKKPAKPDKPGGGKPNGNGGGGGGDGGGDGDSGSGGAGFGNGVE
jgi:outer membrane murein-binding lipoprotein Lpp